MTDSHGQPGSQHQGTGPKHATPQSAPPGSQYGPDGPGYGEPAYGPQGTGPEPTAEMYSGSGASAYPDDRPQYGYENRAPEALDVGRAISYGWEKFRADAPTWIAVSALGVLLYLVFVLVVRIFEPTSLFTVLLLFLVLIVGVWVLQAAMIRGALYESDGHRPTFGAFFQYLNAGNVVLTALLAFTLTLLASAFCLLPGIVVGFLCMFSLHFVIDQDMGPLGALKASAGLVVGNLWPVVLLTLAVLVITFLGLLACGLGLLVAFPIATLAVTYAFRTLTGGPLSPA